MSAVKKTPSFAEAFQELEEITGWFDREDVDLEKGLEKFARALTLAEQCRASLTVFDLRLKELKEQHAKAYEPLSTMDRDES